MAGLINAQIPITLKPQTVQAFDQYAKQVETQQLEVQWRSKQFLQIDAQADLRQRILDGEISIRSGADENPVEIEDGLVHDWVGDVFLPHTGIAKVLDLLEDFDSHSKIYPEITRSHLIRRDGNSVSGYWRLEKKDQLIPVVLDVLDDAKYQEIGPGKWISHAYAKDIVEVENPGSEREKKLPVGRGNGFLWRLYAYWTLESVSGGVLAECRTLSLSRNIPPGLGWMVKPFIKNLPRESLTATMTDTRTALAH